MYVLLARRLLLTCGLHEVLDAAVQDARALGLAKGEVEIIVVDYMVSYYIILYDITVYYIRLYYLMYFIVYAITLSCTLFIKRYNYSIL